MGGWLPTNCNPTRKASQLTIGLRPICWGTHRWRSLPVPHLSTKIHPSSFWSSFSNQITQIDIRTIDGKTKSTATCACRTAVAGHGEALHDAAGEERQRVCCSAAWHDSADGEAGSCRLRQHCEQGEPSSASKMTCITWKGLRLIDGLIDICLNNYFLGFFTCLTQMYPSKIKKNMH